jgi:uncharacterized protein YraI
MKKITALLLALMMVFAFAACGESEEPEPETTTEAAATTHEVSGLVEELSNANLSIYTEADQHLTFNIENASIESEDGIKNGDTAIVEYEGKISNGDTSECEVLKVTDVAAVETTIEGKVESIGSDNTVTISSNGKQFTFKTDKAGSVKTGATVKIKYAGVLEGEDTSHAYVRSMEVAQTTEATEATKGAVSIKAVDETVWATADVNVRADSSTDAKKVGTLKKGKKITRTGVLNNGWSRVKYDNQDCYIASSYLTLKDPAAKKETKATKTETKATETKATESKTETKTEATESKTETNTVTEEPQTDTDTQTVTEETESQTQETEAQTEETEPQTEETEPPTVTAKGVVTAVGSNSLTLDNGSTYNLKGAKVDGILSADNAVGQEVVVEYYENSKDAVSVYPVGGSKALDSESGTSGVTTIAIILALIAIAIAAIVVFLRNRRKNAA